MIRAGAVEVAIQGNPALLRRALAQARREAQQFDKAAARGTQGATAAMNQLGTSVTKARSAVAALNSTLGLVGSLAVGYGIYSGIRSFAEFESTMNNVKAVSGALGSEFAILNQKATELGSTTKFTATQVAESMSFMAMAGLNTGQIFAGVESTLSLAAAGNLDLGQSADIVTNILTGMGLKVSDLDRAVDVLTKTFTSSNTTLTDLGSAFKYAAPAAATAGIQFEEVAAALGLMGNAGVQASMAGTSMRGAIIRLLDPTKEAQKAMNRIGLEVFDASGKMRKFSDIIRDLEPIMARGAQGVQDLSTIFGARPFQGISAVIRQGGDELERFTKNLENARGTAKRIADTQMEGLKGAFIELKSAAEGLAIAIGESGLGKALENFTDSVTSSFRSATQAVRELAPLAEQSSSVLTKNLESMNVELRNIDRQILQVQQDINKPGLGLFGDSSKSEAALAFLKANRERLMSNIESAQEFLRLQRQMKETITPKFGTAVEPIDPSEIPPEPFDFDTAASKRTAALRALQSLESQYLQMTQQNSRLIQVESARELENFQKLLQDKLISQEEYEEAVRQLAVVTQEKMNDLRERDLESVRKIGDAISSNLEGAFRDFVENGKVDFQELTQSILSDIAVIALRMAVLQPLFGGGGIGGGGGAFGNILASVFHSGGKVGNSAPQRSVPAAAFIGAPRLHNGGRIFGPGEVPAVLQKGERVLAAGESTGTVVQIINQSNARIRDDGETQGADGTSVRRLVIEEVGRAINQGKYDGVMRNRYGTQVTGTRR